MPKYYVFVVIANKVILIPHLIQISSEENDMHLISEQEQLGKLAITYTIEY